MFILTRDTSTPSLKCTSYILEDQQPSSALPDEIRVSDCVYLGDELAKAGDIYKIMAVHRSVPSERKVTSRNPFLDSRASQSATSEISKPHMDKDTLIQGCIEGVAF